MKNILLAGAFSLLPFLPAFANSSEADSEEIRRQEKRDIVDHDSVSQRDFTEGPRGGNPVGHPSHHFNPEAEKALRFNAPVGYKGAVPHFALFGKENLFYLGIGGYVKATVGEDAGDPLSNPNNCTTSALQPATPGNHTKFNLSAQQSMVYVNFVALPGSENQIGAFFAMNFLGKGYTPVVQYAYVNWRGINAGLNYSIFSDTGATPPTIDYEGCSSITSMPVGCLSYVRDLGKDKKFWRLGAGIQSPVYSVTPDPFTKPVNQPVPDIVLAARYNFAGNENNFIKLSGALRNLYYRYEPSDRNIDVLGWGVSLCGTSEIVGNLRGYFNATFGRGIDSFIQDLNGMNYDLTPRAGTDYLKPHTTWGAFGALQYNFTSSVYCTAQYSHVRTYAHPWASADAPYGPEYKYAQYTLGNLFWDINSILSTGVEYIYGRRVNHDGSQAHVNRIQAMLQVTF